MQRRYLCDLTLNEVLRPMISDFRIDDDSMRLSIFIGAAAGRHLDGHADKTNAEAEARQRWSDPEPTSNSQKQKFPSLPAGQTLPAKEKEEKEGKRRKRERNDKSISARRVYMSLPVTSCLLHVLVMNDYLFTKHPQKTPIGPRPCIVW